MNILTFTLGMWLLVVAIAWCFENIPEILAERKAARDAKKETEEQKAAKALLMLTVAGLHKNAAVTYTRKPGTHRLTKV
ncbi:hypothetical protein SEA_MADAMATO_71 [Streptomyces phage Madamato]|nr:hypothetical protein SEA_MADAMATO_71 [Streptomyces phage Madamato]